MYHLVLRNRRLHYAPGTLPTTLGPLPLQSGGFMLTGVPLVMGEHPGPQIAKAEASLAKMERALYHLRPGLRARPPHRPPVRSLGPGLCLRGHAAVPDAPAPHAAGIGQSLD